MKTRHLAPLLLVYVFAIVVLFKGVKAFETVAREAWFNSVTKRLVSRTSGIPNEQCILGIFRPELPYSFGPLRTLESDLGTKFNLVSFYQAWGDSPEHRFPAALLEQVVEQGCVPMVTWEPWVGEFDQTRTHLRPMPLRENRYLADVGSGAYDFHIVEWAKSAVAWGKPFFLRFAHEMTNHQYPWSDINGNTAVDYQKAWWRVHAIFDSVGAHNVLWVWCPYKQNSLDYYPGETQVDWVAMDVFNYGELIADAGDQRWADFDLIAYSFYRELSGLQKPIMIAEAGSTDFGGSRAMWYRDMLIRISSPKYANVKALVFFDNPADRTSGKWTIDWSLQSSEELIEEARGVLKQGYFTFVPEYHRFLSRTHEGG